MLLLAFRIGCNPITERETDEFDPVAHRLETGTVFEPVAFDRLLVVEQLSLPSHGFLLPITAIEGIVS